MERGRKRKKERGRKRKKEGERQRKKLELLLYNRTTVF